MKRWNPISSLIFFSGMFLGTIIFYKSCRVQDPNTPSIGTPTIEAQRKPKSPKEELASLGIIFDEKSFVQQVTRGRTREVSLFLKAGMSPDAKGDTGSPAIVIASSGGYPQIVDLLIEAGADINGANKGLTALMAASGDCNNAGTVSVENKAKPECTVIVKDLLEAGADVNSESQYGSPLMKAVEADNVETVQLLLDAGARDIDSAISMVNREQMKASWLLRTGSGGSPEAERIIHAEPQRKRMLEILQNAKDKR